MSLQSPMLLSNRQRAYVLAWLGLALLLLAAFAMRVYRLDAVPLRGDEAYSIMHWSAPPFTERWERLIREEPAPVGAFTMYWLWSTLTGDSEFAVRYLSLLGNVVGLAAVIVLAKRLMHDWRLAGLAGVLWAVHPYLIWHAQDARVYGVLSALSPLAFYWLLRALAAGSSDLKGWLPYIAAQTAAIYLYYLEPFWVAAQAVYVGLYALSMRRGGQADGQIRGSVSTPDDRWRIIWRAFRAWVVIGVLSIPVMAQLYHLMFVSNYEGNAGSADFAMFFSEFVPTLLFGDNVWHPAAGALAAVVLFAGLGWIARRDFTAGVLLLMWILVPNILLYFVSFFSDFFRPRYVTTVIPALILALVLIPAWLSGGTVRGRTRGYAPAGYGQLARRRYLYLPAAVVVFMAGLSLLEVRDYFFYDPPKAADWRGLTDYLGARTTAQDMVLSDSVDPALEYYYRGPARVVFVPKDNPDPAEYVPGLLTEFDAVFLLSGERTGEVGQFLQAHAQPVPGDMWPGIIQYRPWVVNPGEIINPLDLTFGEVAILRGYTLVGDTTLILYWETLATTETEHSVLLHLENAIRGAPRPPDAVLDHAIAGAVVSTRTWSPGTLYRDPIALPSDLPEGEYVLYVGMYETATEARLPIIEDVTGVYEGRYPAGVVDVPLLEEGR